MSQPDCDCRRFLQPFTGEAELPDHVCEEVARIVCSNWLTFHWPLPRSVSLTTFAAFSAGTVDTAEPTHRPIPCYVGHQEGRVFPQDQIVVEDRHGVAWRVAIPLIDKLFAKPFVPQEWPVPLERAEGVLALVIEQEVEDKSGQRQLVKALEASPLWQYALQELPQQPKYTSEGQRDPLRFVQEFLAEHGLPSTARIAEYAVWRLEHQAGERGGPQPSRGVFVTTFCLWPGPEGKPGFASTVSQISAPSAWSTNRLLEAARTAMNQHAAWWEATEAKPAGVPFLRGDLSQYNEGRPSKQSERQDNLSTDVERYVAGELNRNQLVSRERDRREKRLQHPLSQEEENTLQNSVRQAIRRCQKV